jgi:hypothetical protein
MGAELPRTQSLRPSTAPSGRDEGAAEMLNHKRTAAIAAALALAGAGPVPSALAQTQDFRSPDAIDASQGRYPGVTRLHQDVRSPDARGADTHYAPAVMESPIAQPTGFDWESAAIGAAAGIGLMVVALALAFGGRRRALVRQG